jgi:hypothetical protein
LEEKPVTDRKAERSRLSSRLKTEAVLRLLCGEEMNSLAHELNVEPESLSGWRDGFLAGGQARLEGDRRVEVGVLGPADLSVATALLARAFDQEAAKLALIPESRMRQVVLEISVRASLSAALRYGTVHAALSEGEIGSIAVWFSPGMSKHSVGGAVQTMPIWLRNLPTVMRGFPRIVGRLAQDVPGFVALLRQRRPAVAQATRGPTWCLELIGTVPEQRNKGLARSLLERQLDRCDQDAAAAWLETTDPVNPPIYEGFGFETLAHIDGPDWLPGYWVMRREPR